MKTEKNEVGEVWEIIKIFGRCSDARDFLKWETVQNLLQKWLQLQFPVKYAKTGQCTFSRLNKMQNNLY